MKKILLASVALFAMASMASAADLPARMYTKAPAVAPAWSWAGFYAGVNVGYGGGETNYPISAGGLGVAEIDITSSGFIGGGQIGYNWQTGNVVYGLEVDFQGSGVESKFEETLPGFGSIAIGTTTDYFGTARARIGTTPWDRSLLYVTGGLAYGHTTTNFGIIGGGFGSPDISNDKIGWTVGAGLEYMIAPKWSFKTEYLYVDLGRDDLDLTALGGFPGTISEESRMHVVRAGVNYHF
ncbi:MAG TPA: outer membrane protein [Xanthobacteraceae bacterium]|jgi:outer membrane immunogenic protein|nr:outer membrane protein [Xanthobacteraceae bacterium]